jgi:hypothetical protein
MVASLGVILVSTITFILSTFDELQADENRNQAYPAIIFAIDVLGSSPFLFSRSSFSLLLCSQVKLKFFFKPMNLVDLIALLALHGAGGAGRLPDNGEGWEDHKNDEGHEDLQSVQAVQAFCWSSVPYVHS